MDQKTKLKKMNIMLDFNKKLISKNLELVDDILFLNDNVEEHDSTRLIELFSQIDTLKGYDESIAIFALDELIPKVTFTDNKFLDCLIRVTVLRTQDIELLKPIIEKSLKYDFKIDKDLTIDRIIDFYSVLTNYCVYIDDEKLTSKLKAKIEKIQKKIGE